MTLAQRCRASLCAWTLLLIPLLAAMSPAHADTQTRSSAFEYDPASGLLTKEIIEPNDPALCLVTTYSYDAYGNKTGSTTRNCNGSSSEAAAPAAGSDALFETRSSSVTYDSKGRFPLTSSNAIGHTESKTFDANYGSVLTLTGPNGLTTRWTYDSFGRVLSETRAEGTVTYTAYTLCSAAGAGCPGNAQYKISTTQAGIPGKTVYYDTLDRAILSETQGFDGSLVRSENEYDAEGRLVRASQPHASSALAVWTQTNYDILDRPTSVTQPDGSTSNVSYNALTTVTTNAKGQTKTEVKNSQGQLVRVVDTQGKTLSFSYDAYGNLTRTVDVLGNTTSISYDKRGRKVAMNDPDQGAWSYGYDALGQLKRQTDAKSQVVTFVYDRLGRMTQRNEPDLKSSWSYDVCDAVLNPAGKCVGKVVKEFSDNLQPPIDGGNPKPERTYLYDAFGRATGELDNVDQSYGVTKSFDSYGRVANIYYPAGLQVSNVYNTAGYRSQVKNTANGTIYWQANSVDAQGRVVSETYGNGVVNTRSYNILGRLVQTQSGTGSAPSVLNNQSFVYDSLGNLTQRYDANTGLNESFGYDSLNRLTASSAQAGGGPLTQVTLTYDAIGNILTKSDVGSYSYGTVDVATGKLLRPHAVTKIMMNDGVTQYGAYTYDANGNMLSGAGRSIAWNSWNMPNSIVGTTPGKSTPNGTTSSSFGFVYNSAHERVREALPNGTILYNISPRVDTGIHVEKRVKLDGTVQYAYSLYAGAYPFGTVTTTTPPNNGTATTATRYFHTDHLGSIVAISNEAGQLVERRSYDAWGKRRNSNGTAMNNAFFTPEERHGFTGHEELDDVGLIHMNGRLYDPATGRFLSADPTIQYADDMQNYNRYSYINNNPLCSVDPSGYGFFSSLFKSIKKLVKKVVHAVKAVLRNPVVRTAIAIYVGYQVGGFFGDEYLISSIASSGMPSMVTANIIAGATGGFTAGLIASGGNLKTALSGAISGGIAGAVAGLTYDSSWYTQIGANSVAGGLRRMVNGGSFIDGFKEEFLRSSLKVSMDKFSGYVSSWSTSIGSAVIKPDNVDVVDPNLANTGMTISVPYDTQLCKLVCGKTVDQARQILGPSADRDLGISGINYYLSEAGPLQYTSKWIPGVRASSVFHDRFVGSVQRFFDSDGSGALSKGFTVFSIPPAFAAQYYALGWDENYRGRF